MKRLIISFLLAFPVIVEAQPKQSTLDSLHLSLQNAANDTVRMDVLAFIGYYYSGINIDSSQFYLERSLSLAQKLKLKLYEAGVLHHQAGMLMGSNYPQALEVLLQALKITSDPASEKNVWNAPGGMTPHNERLNKLGYTHYNMGQLYGNTGNTEKQIISILKAKGLAEAVQDSGLNLVANLVLGDVYLSKLKKLDSALYFEQKALSLFSNSGRGFKDDLGWVFGSIGAIYLEKRNFNLSRDAFQKGLQLMQEVNDLGGVGNIYLSLSNFYRIIDKPDSSLTYAFKALEIYKAFNDKKGIANAYSSLSSAYQEQKKTDSAFAYLKSATALHDSLNNVERQSLLAYQNASFDEQMRLKKLEDEKIQTRNKVRTYAMLAGLAVFMAIAFLLYRNNHHRKKANLLLQKQRDEIAEQKENIEQTLVELKSAQAQLIQSEKMASLGELTAGIAHEIQNPLNFVNNFSEVNTELIDELRNEQKKEPRDFENENGILNDIEQNIKKVNHHGRRADAIVKGMLQHSTKTTGVKEPTDINKLADEYLRLSYHGLRAKNKDFNVDLMAIGFETDFDAGIGKINIVQKDIGRVLLNLFNNAFYAVNEKNTGSGPALRPYKPTVSVQTKKLNDMIEIVVKDNGNGIPKNIVDKIYQPFFTTKPTGQGTGLGLSLSYDIMKAHGGEIKVETKDGKGTEFIISLPNV